MGERRAKPVSLDFRSLTGTVRSRRTVADPCRTGSRPRHHHPHRSGPHIDLSLAVFVSTSLVRSSVEIGYRRVRGPFSGIERSIVHSPRPIRWRRSEDVRESAPFYRGLSAPSAHHFLDGRRNALKTSVACAFDRERVRWEWFRRDRTGNAASSSKAVANWRMRCSDVGCLRSRSMSLRYCGEIGFSSSSRRTSAASSL